MFGRGEVSGRSQSWLLHNGRCAAKRKTKAGESSHLTNKEPGCGVASQGQDLCWETVARVRAWHRPVVSRQGGSGEAGPRPSQDAKSASLGQGWTHGDVRCCKESHCLSLKAALKGKEGQAVAASFFHNCSYQWRSWPWTLPAKLLQGGNVLRTMAVWGLEQSYGTRPTQG